MKHILLLLFFVAITPLFAQKTTQQEYKDGISKYTLNQKILIEDKNGRLITDTVARRVFFTKRQEEVNINNTPSKTAKSLALTSDAVQICTNGGFEEFETAFNTRVLKNFKSTVGYPTNPTQCASVSVTADQSIKQYDPNDSYLMVSTIPSNFLDPYMGNIDAFDQYALKLNFRESSSTLAIVQAKRFKNNNENLVKFNYKAVLQSITGSDHKNEQPYFKARILNKKNIVVSEFCVIGDAENCIFAQANDLAAGSIVLYTKNWQNGTLDISAIPNNEEFTIEFMTARCGLSGHFGYSYIDDICFLHSTENTQGSIELNPLNKICPTLPIAVCGTFSLPNSGGISATVKAITLKVLDQANKVVYTTATTSSLDLINNRFCFNLDQSNLPDTTTGNYNISVAIDYGISKTDCGGTTFKSVSDNDANPGWDISFMNCTSTCNFTIQSGTIEQCDLDGDGTESFDLTNVLTQVIGSQTGLTAKYYTNFNDASNETNEIKNDTDYHSATTSLFVRVTESSSCFKIVAINLVLKNPTANILGSLNICGGSTVLTATAGQSYLWGGGEETQSITATSTGLYTVEVTDASGCVSTASITIPDNQVAPQPTLDVKQPDCFTSTGTITITSDASEYSFDGGTTWSTVASQSNLTVGNYLIKVKTVLGCISYTTRVTINAFYLTFPNYTSINPKTCNDYGSITITTVADEYSFDDGKTWSKNNTASSLPSGTYNIRTKNQFGCISSSNSVTLNSEYLQAPSYNAVQPKCGVGGTIKITSVAAEYSFNNGLTWSTNPVASDLDPGIYNLMIKNTLGCISYSQYVNLEVYHLKSPTYTIVQPECGKGGTIKINTTAKLYSFDNGVTWTTDPVATDLPPGLYYIMIQNDLGCKSRSQYVSLDYYYLDYPTFTVTQPVCGVGGTISIDTVGSEYSFDNGKTWTTNPVSTDLPPGYYSLLYKNDLGCISYSQYAYLSTYYLPAATITLVQPECGIGGSITITTPASEYSFDGGNTWTTNNTATDLPPGYRTVLYKNDLDCLSTYLPVNLNYYFLPAPTYVAVSPSCGNIGSIKITTAADFYSFDNGYTWTTNPLITNLSPGYYNFKIKNNLGCQSQTIGIYLDSSHLANPSYELTKPTCDQKGSIKITTAADFYSFDNGSTWTTNNTLLDAEPNRYYYLLIKNTAGCTSNAQSVYLNNFYLDNPNYITKKPTCGYNGEITITTPADFYSFDNGITWSTSPTLSNPVPGVYYQISIKNNLNCTSLPQSVYLQPFYLNSPRYTVRQPSCGVAGNITITTLADYYSFDNGTTWTTNPSFNNPLPNNYYYILIKNSLGCTSTAQYVYIPAFYLDSPDFDYEPAICGKKASITVTTTADQYSFDGGNTWTTNPVASDLKAGYYNIVIKNNLGCISNYVSVNVAPFYLAPPAFDLVNPTCDSKGSITIASAADFYSFDNGYTWTTNPTLTNLTYNYYYIKIKNNLGCESNYQIVYVQSIPNISAKPSIKSTAPSKCGAKDASITVVTYATAYSFDNGVTWSSNPTSGLLEAGTYQVRVKEYSSSCSSDPVLVVLNPIASLAAPTFSTTQPMCNINTGNIIISSIAAQYSFDNGTTWQTENSKNDLPPGDYLIQIKNGTGCISDPITVKINVFSDFPAFPTASKNQTFCIDQNATLADINIQGTAITWYDSATAIHSLPQTTLLENHTYYATQTLNNCQSTRVGITVKLQDTPKPMADAPQTFCIQENASLKKINITGENIKWYESETSNVSLSESTILENGFTYYASQTNINCESERIAVAIQILAATTVECVNYLKELPYPKFFTPNNDGYNDTWTVDFAYLAPNTGIHIFDRYGKFIKELQENSPWDGNYLGQQLPASDYWFVVTRSNGTEFRGHFSLKR